MATILRTVWDLHCCIDLRCSIATFSRGWNNLAVPRLLEQLACRQHRAARSCSPKTKKDMSDGTVYQRHQNHERFVRAPAAGYLLCREAAREGASKDG